MNRMTQQLLLSGIIIGCICFHMWRVGKLRKSEKGNKVLSVASQITYSAFMLGFAVILSLLNMTGLSKNQFTYSLLCYGAFVSLVNLVSLLYYERKYQSKDEIKIEK